jgi:hypothetical protein
MTRLRRPSFPTVSQIVGRVFESPKLMAAVRELPGPVLSKLINSVGLEDAAELVALATTQQLESIFDEELWKGRPGDWEEHFDPARFALWLHAFSEAGEDALINRFLELPLDFLILAVHRLILVIDIDSMALEMSNSGDDLDLVEKALDNCVCEEWEEFRLIARDDSAWEELSCALLALDRDHHDLLRKILERCAAMSSEWIADNGGLYEVLTSDEMLEADVRAERDDRRAQKGFVATSDARAFLELARGGAGAPLARDPITKAYFRALAPPSHQAIAPRKARTGAAASHVAGLLRLLEEASIVEPNANQRVEQAITSRAPALPAKSLVDIKPTQREPAKAAARLLDGALSRLRESAPERYRERLEELAYLANVLIAAPRHQRERQRPVEALESALQTVNRGLERAIGSENRRSDEESMLSAVTVLSTTTADCLFRLGFPDAGATVAS